MPVPVQAPQFSVVMNIYNGAPYLRAAIDSVLAQTVDTWELILFDDRSTDDSAAICRSFADPRIRYAAAEHHLPVAQAREQAIALTRAPWIAFLDQDDIWLPDKLAAQAAEIAADPAQDLGLVYSRTDCFDARGRRWPFDRWSGSGRLPHGALFDLLLQRPSFICLSSIVLRRSALLPLLPMPPHVKLCPDYFLCLGAARAWRTACVQDLMTLYRVHLGNMTRRFRGPIHAEAMDIIRHAAGPEHAAIVRRRNAVHNTWIAVEEILSGPQRRQGLRRLFTRGSVAYLAGRPLLLAGRRAMRALRPARSQRGTANAPSLARAPATDRTACRTDGPQLAAVVADLISRHAGAARLRVVECGCGKGGMTRHLAPLLAGRLATLTGVDSDGDDIAWCRSLLPDARFRRAGPDQRLPIETGSADLVCCVTEFATLTEPELLARVREFHRVLAPGGLLICATWGDGFRHLLTDAHAQRQYDAGDAVELEPCSQGPRPAAVLHPRAFVQRALLTAFVDVSLADCAARPDLRQDFWIARKPRVARAA